MHHHDHDLHRDKSGSQAEGPGCPQLEARVGMRPLWAPAGCPWGGFHRYLLALAPCRGRGPSGESCLDNNRYQAQRETFSPPTWLACHGRLALHAMESPWFTYISQLSAARMVGKPTPGKFPLDGLESDKFYIWRTRS